MYFSSFLVLLIFVLHVSLPPGDVCCPFFRSNPAFHGSASPLQLVCMFICVCVCVCSYLMLENRRLVFCVLCGPNAVSPEVFVGDAALTRDASGSANKW